MSEQPIWSLSTAPDAGVLQILCSLGLHVCSSTPNAQSLSHQLSSYTPYRYGLLFSLTHASPALQAPSLLPAQYQPQVQTTLQDKSVFLIPIPHYTVSACKTDAKP